MPQTDSIFVTVVVPTHNRAKLMRDCVQSLIVQDFPSYQYEIIVVDDGSNDDTADVAKTICSNRPSPCVRFLFLPPGGGNRARNQGIKSAAGRIICFIDDDEVVPQGHVKSVVQLLDEAPDLHGVGGPVHEYSNSRVRTCRGCSLGTSEFPGFGKRKAGWLLGGNMAVRKRVFEGRGLFDEDLRGYGDEWEWFQRDPPLDLLYDPDLWVWHRRDRQTLIDLCRSAWFQGLGIPHTHAKGGIKATPSLTQLLRYLGHAMRRLCAAGIILACREAAALYETRALRRADASGRRI